jgi:hypothetical protein
MIKNINKVKCDKQDQQVKAAFSERKVNSKTKD